MARLIGVDLPREKRLEVALTYIYGIGKTRSLQTLEATQISGDVRVHQLTDEQLVALRDWMATFAGRSHRTSGARSRSVPIRDAVTAAACR